MFWGKRKKRCKKESFTHSALAASTPSTSPIYSRFERRTWSDGAIRFLFQIGCRSDFGEEMFQIGCRSDFLRGKNQREDSLESLLTRVFHMLHFAIFIFCKVSHHVTSCETLSSSLTSGWRLSSLKDVIKYCSLSNNNRRLKHLSHLVWASAQAAGESGEGSTAAG